MNVFLFGVITFVGLVSALVMLLSRERKRQSQVRQSAWQDFSQRLGLSFVDHATANDLNLGHWRIRGIYNGVSVELAQVCLGRTKEEIGVSFRADFSRELPFEIFATRRDSLEVEDYQELESGSEIVVLNIGNFDREVLVEASKPIGEAKSWLIGRGRFAVIQEFLQKRPKASLSEEGIEELLLAADPQDDVLLDVLREITSAVRSLGGGG